MTGQNRSPIFWYLVLIMQFKIMEKESKFCTGVLLRAEPTGHSHPTHFGRKGLDGHVLLGQPPKRTPMQDFNSFSILFYYISSTTYQKIGDLFCPVHISGLSHSVLKKKFFCFDKEKPSFCKKFGSQIKFFAIKVLT